jgi:hypothetical protein
LDVSKAKNSQILHKPSSDLEPLNFSSIDYVQFKKKSIINNESPDSVIEDALGMYNFCWMDRVPLGPIIAINYTDAGGRVTVRLIRPRELINEPCGLFTAYCFLRDDEREFRTDRVNSWFDPLTGKAFASGDAALKEGLSIRKRLMQIRREVRSGRKMLDVRFP